MNEVRSRKVILVSGGSRGLGGAIVEHLLRQGHCVAAFSRNESPAIAKLVASEEFAGRFEFSRADARDQNAIEKVVRGVFEKWNRLDVLVNNVGVAEEGLLALMDDDSIDRVIDVNLNSLVKITRICTRRMLAQGDGAVINISSIAASHGAVGLAVYSATKAGVEGLTRSLARELGGRKIRVNAIAPGYLETEMSATLPAEVRERIIRRTPLGRLGQVGDILPWIELLLSEEGGFVTGQVITVDGGMSA